MRYPRLTRLRGGSRTPGLLAAVLLLVGCGPAADGPGAAGEAPRDPNAPGVFEVGPNEFEAVVVAFEGGFDPSEMRFPVGAEVHFRVRSADLVHGFLVEGTGIEFEVDPLEPAGATHTFEEAGEYNLHCHVYCGGGHPAMLGTVIVE